MLNNKLILFINIYFNCSIILVKEGAIIKKNKEEKIRILKEAKRKEHEYHLLRITRKNFIKNSPHHFFKLLWFYITYPFIWIWRNIKDWRTFLIFFIVFLIVSIEVWLPYLLGVITWGSDFSKAMFAFGSACWLFWLGPGTPFLSLCIVITIGIKSIFNKIRFRNID